MPRDDRETPPDSSDSSVPAAASDDRELSPGAMLGRLVVLQKLGQGGMGVVYAAFDPELDRRVAVKLLRGDRAAASPERKDRLLREAKDLARLSHPNVVTVHDVQQHLGQVFIAMEFMAGGDLGDWLDSAARAPRDIVRVFIAAGEGLAAAHASGLIHRDFKPDNVLLDAHGAPHVTDFGLAEQFAAAAAGTRRAGTPGYMAPEQARGEPIDARADQFSFCVSLYEALYGKKPFPKDLDPGRPLPLIEAAPAGSTVPAYVRRVVFKGLAEDRNARYGSMPDLLAALADDPAVRRRARQLTTVSVFSVAALVAAGGWLVSRESAEERAVRLCSEHAQVEADAVAGDARKAQIAKAFAASDGAATWAGVQVRLDGEVVSWRRAAGRACELGESDPERHRFTACLEERRKTLQSLSDLFATADRGVVEHALNTMMLEVQPVESCRTTTQPAAAPSEDVDERTRSGLARARVLKTAGKYADAIRELLRVAVEAEAPDPKTPQAPRVAAEARLLLGELYADLRRTDAEANLLRSIALAELASSDEVRARGWMVLIAWYSDRNRFEEARQASDQANAICSRLGRPPLLEAARLNQEGQLAMRQHEIDEALDAFRTAVELRRAQLPPGHPLLARSMTNLALTLPPDEGLPLAQKVLATRLELFGKAHPETADALHNIALIHLKSGECAQALDFFERALAARAASPDLLRRGNTLTWKAKALGCLERLEEAYAIQREGVRALEDGNALDEQMVFELRNLLNMCTRLKRLKAECAEIEEKIKARTPQ